MSYEVGVARVDMTPPQAWIDDGRIWLWGFGSRTAPCDGILDPLEARALAVRDAGGATAVIVTLDLGALDPSSTDRIRQRVLTAHGIAGEYVCVNVSHTHTAPVFASIPTWQPGVDVADDGYVGLVEDAAVAAVELAITDLRPSRLEFGRAESSIAVDRHPVGVPLDRTLDVVVATGADEATIAVLFTTACHPVARGSIDVISSDFVGPARAAVEAATGGTALFVQGYGGTCNPGSGDAAAIGAALGAEVGSVLAGPLDVLDGPLDAWASQVELPLQPIRPGAVAANVARGDEVGRWARWMQAQGAAVPDVLPVPLQAVRIGTGRDAWYLAASGHEVVMDLAASVRALWPYRRVTTAAYCNSQLSYLPGRRVLQAPPCTDFPACYANYEGGHAFVWYGHRGPLTLDGEQLFLDAHVRLLDVGWVPIGHATSVVAMASWRDRLFAATSNGVLWWRPTTADEPGDVVPWRAMGHATDVCGLAVCDGVLFAATAAGTLWRRPINGYDRAWVAIGHAQQVAAMTAMEGRLFAATTDDKLWRRDPVPHDVGWEELGHAQQVAGLAAADGVLLAATRDGGLHWRPPFAGDLGWRRYGHAQEIVGLTAVGDTLYAATAAGTLWRRPV